MSVPRRLTLARCFMVVVISGLAWRLLRFFLNFDLSGDEADILINVMARGYDGLLNPLDYSQASPPAFLWAVKLCDSLFRNEWGVRLLPFLAGVAGMAVFWLLCKEVLRGAARWVAWAVFNVSYVPVAESTCAKGYTIDLLAAMLLFWLMLRWLRGGQQAKYLLWLGLCAPFFVWLSYTSVFVIGAISLVFLAHSFRERGKNDWSGVMAGFLFMALAGASAVWLYEVNIRPSQVLSQISGLQDFWSTGYPPLHQPWKIPLWLLEVQTGRGFAWPLGEKHFGSTLTIVLWLTGLVVCWRRGNRWVWALFVLPQALLLIASFLHKYPYGADPRICLFLGPGLCLFMGAGVQFLLGRLEPQRRRTYYCALAFLLLMIAICGATRDVALRIREIKGPDVRSTLVAAGRIMGTDGQFVVLTGETSQVLTYYLRRYVAQPTWWAGEIPPSQARAGSNLAVLAGIRENNRLDSDPFGEFEKRLGKPMTPIWTQVARIRSETKARVEVRIYHVGSP